MITASEAAKRMGVKVETIYAYVSRGLLERHAAPDGRGSQFDARAIEALAQRGRPRQATQQGAMNLTIETALTSLSSEGVRYRGLPSAELARTHTFEQVAELLWTGRLGEGHRAWKSARCGRRDRPAVHPAPGRGAADRPRRSRLHSSGHAPDASAVSAAGRLLIATMVDTLPPVGDGAAARLVLSSPLPVATPGSGVGARDLRSER